MGLPDKPAKIPPTHGVKLNVDYVNRDVNAFHLEVSLYPLRPDEFRTGSVLVMISRSEVPAGSWVKKGPRSSVKNQNKLL